MLLDLGMLMSLHTVHSSLNSISIFSIGNFIKPSWNYPNVSTSFVSFWVLSDIEIPWGGECQAGSFRTHGRSPGQGAYDREKHLFHQHFSTYRTDRAKYVLETTTFAGAWSWQKHDRRWNWKMHRSQRASVPKHGISSQEVQETESKIVYFFLALKFIIFPFWKPLPFWN